MRDFKKLLLGGAAVVTLAAVAGAPVSAMAQAQPQTANQDDEDEDEATEVEAVTVTGSRIRRNEFNSAAPVTVITSEQATLEGIVDTAELLQQSSVASGSFQNNNTLTGFVGTGGGGTQSVSLRGLGAQRTLSLINGKRAGPAGTRGTVQAFDLNVLPQSMIERVEILNDSASSVYGSDAIAGVINYITRRDLDGFQFDAYANVPAQEGGEQYRVSGTWGATFDRGNFAVGFDYFAQEPLRRGQRDYLDCAEDYYTSVQDPAGDRVDLIDPFTGEYKCFGLFAGVLRANAGGGTMDFFYPVAGRTYATPQQGASVWIANMVRQGRGGFPATFAHGNYQFGSNGEGPFDFYGRASLIGEVDRYTVFSNFNYDLTPGMELYGEFMHNKRRSSQEGARQFFPTTSAFIPTAQRPDNGLPFSAATILPIIPMTSTQIQNVDYTRAVVGIRGDFSLGFLRNWGYDIYGQWARSEGEYRNPDALYADRVAAVTGVDPAVTTLTSADACYQTDGTFFDNLSNYDCSDLPGGVRWTTQDVLEGRFSDAERNFLMFEAVGNTEYTHQYVEAVFSGDLFELPAGPMAAAVGFHLRREELNDVPDEQVRLGNIWGSSSAGITAGEDTVREAFAELEVPLIRDVRFIDSLTANVSGRISDYDSYGRSDTYKVGINWQINPSWRIRATRGTSFRAPSLYEQFLGNQTSFPTQAQIDPCIQWELNGNANIQQNCAAEGVPAGYTAAGNGSATAIAQGGAFLDIQAETGEASTIGVVWTPSFIDLNVAVDYFHIEISDEVTQYGTANILSQCYRSVAYPTDPLCALFTRDPVTFAILTVQNPYVNIAEQTNRGIDLSVRYGHEFGFGDLTIDGQFTWQLQDVSQLFPDSPVQDLNGSTYSYDGPDFSGNLNFRFDRGDWTLFWGVTMFGKASDLELYQAAGLDETSAISRYYRCSGDGGVTFVDCPSVTGPTGTLLPGYTIPGAAAQDPNYVVNKMHNEFTATHTFSVRRNFGDWSVQAGVNNVFDEHPPAVSPYAGFRQGISQLGNYDYVGRRAFFRVSARF
ncbi:TonB-dependent receptor [Brevundimonas sp. 2R-24]|uniref:TonB-dependent receptor n=1 Tax=Peiella sedimenti TaxID=3061083 RepID=A0ABT8SJ96_9CAUL|nr:TonB-dependent receptor [Caulobacteraceae bacterium XZ-24]